jgi:hypothetical protein
MIIEIKLNLKNLPQKPNKQTKCCGNISEA